MNRQRGAAMMHAIVLMGLFAAAVSAVSAARMRALHSVAREICETRAFYAAEAGLATSRVDLRRTFEGSVEGATFLTDRNPSGSGTVRAEGVCRDSRVVLVLRGGVWNQE